mgnify:CR=1|jgi:hypothetical protein
MRYENIVVVLFYIQGRPDGNLFALEAIVIESNLKLLPVGTQEARSGLHEAQYSCQI